MPERKRKPSLVEIMIILAILFIFMSIIGGGKQKQKAQPSAAGPPAAYQPTEPGKGERFFWRP